MGAPTLDSEPAESSIPCVRCGYDLRSLPLSGVCPECAEPVLHAHRGLRLSSLSEPTLAAQLRGVRLTSLGLWCVAITWIPRIFVDHPALSLLSVAGTPPILIGLWWLCGADSLTGWDARARRSRAHLRAAIVVDAAVSLLLVSALLILPARHDELFALRARFGWTTDGPGRAFALLGTLAAAVRTATLWLAIRHLTTLAIFAEDPPTHRRALGLLRAIPVLAILLAIGGAGAILTAAADAVGFLVIWAIALIAAITAGFVGLMRILGATHSNLAAALISRRYGDADPPDHA